MGLDMEICKILNNNVAIIHDVQGKEQVVMGRGLAFQKRAGDSIDPAAVEKVFSLQNQVLTGRMSELLAEIPQAVTTTSECIIALAEKELGGNLHESLVIGLTDHINFALQRHKENIPLRNVLRWEIRCLYPKEYAVGLSALDIICRCLGPRLEEDEAGFIALHLVSAQLSNMPDVLYITRFMQQILDIVKYYLQIEYQPDSLSYIRFVTHLKFFAQRMLSKRAVSSDEDPLHEVVRNRYPRAYRCAEKIDRHIVKNYAYRPGPEERMFLTIHIEQVRKETLAIEELEDEV